MGRGYPPPQPIKGMEERSKLTQWGPAAHSGECLAAKMLMISTVYIFTILVILYERSDTKEAQLLL